MMKRAAFSSHQSDKEARARFKHQTLLQDYLELQKEFELKKKKLPCTKQKRDSLSLKAEIRFLRQRRKHLLTTQSPTPNLDCEPSHLPNSSLQRRMRESERNPSASGAPLANQYPVLAAIKPNSIDQEEQVAEGKQLLRGKKSKQVFEVKKPSKNYFIDDKRITKKRISCKIH